ncbi:C_GCAxxG_C_C family probable redox protein [Breznakia sp. PF5-3]|uniref:C-GCAxxG-C-C family (seleno)protein n=1 Tax=unclassified Breznakia TaxID=2623764 RepID=UPI00240617E5|nr:MULTISPECIES: C-GCAxxG-C-C family (seleno)protein [unclassified Breznakia]MDF9823992.1 C_GCAxxG_C_C family probable redox protein [Breznakia sp. PM6-1]MDF9834791.1 C_GCAxxG_C_C family probable redox protein [Breznakia sp. PF5-3]
MLREVAEKYYLQGYNCAEAMIRAGNEYYNLGLHEHDMRMTAAFGGGFQIGDVCGALSGSACVVSCKYVERKAHDNQEQIRSITQKLVLAFQKELGSRLCSKVKPIHYNKEVKCQNTVGLSADVLEKIINDFEKEINA